MKKKAILYIEINYVLADPTTIIEHFDLNFLREHKDSIFKLPGTYSKISPVPGAIEAYHELTKYYEIFPVHRNTQKADGMISDIQQWVEKNLGKEAVEHLVFIPHFSLLKGDYLIYYRYNSTPMFEGEIIPFELEHPKVHWNMVRQSLIANIPKPDRHLTFPITVRTHITLLKESWNADAEHLFMYEFNEEELQILAQEFQGYSPSDDVGNLVDENLWKLEDFIYERTIDFSNSQTLFNGEPEDILRFLYEYYAYFPMDFVKKDIQKGNFIPSCSDWQDCNEETLISEWCDWRRKTFHKISYLALTHLFEQEYQASFKLADNVDFSIYLPQELYDFIQKENDRQAKP